MCDISQRFSQRMRTGLHCTNGIIRSSRSTTSIFLKVSQGEKFKTAARPSLEPSRWGLSKRASPPPSLITLWAVVYGSGPSWKRESCKELLSLHDHKRHNSSAKWMIQGCKNHRGLYKVLCFFIWESQGTHKSEVYSDNS